MTDKPKLTCRMFGFAQQDIELAQDLLERIPRLVKHFEFDQTAQLDLTDLVIIDESVEELRVAWQRIQARRSTQGLVLPDVLYVRDVADALVHAADDSREIGNLKTTAQRAEFFSQQGFARNLTSWMFDWLTTSYAKTEVQTDAGTALRMAA